MLSLHSDKSELLFLGATIFQGCFREKYHAELLIVKMKYSQLHDFENEKYLEFKIIQTFSLLEKVHFRFSFLM